MSSFNASVRPGTFNRDVLDDCSTVGLSPPKSHWARALDTPPFFAYPLRPGITFTYLGVAVNERAQVLLQDDAPDSEPVRGGRDHGRQHPRPGLSRRIRHVHRHDVRSDRRRAGGTACRRADVLPIVQEGERVMRICNACRYCEGFCAVFPAMEQRLTFSEPDLNYLANLCHDCGECLYSCQYAPPHEFAVNVPQLFAQIRRGDVPEVCLAAPVCRALSTTRAAMLLGALIVPACFLIAAGARHGSCSAVRAASGTRRLLLSSCASHCDGWSFRWRRRCS